MGTTDQEFDVGTLDVASELESEKESKSSMCSIEYNPDVGNVPNNIKAHSFTTGCKETSASAKESQRARNAKALNEKLRNVMLGACSNCSSEIDQTQELDYETFRDSEL